MARYKLTIEYDGGGFAGWQHQDNGPSVQAALEDAVFAYCGVRAVIEGAGRTDAGVHASAQVAHVDLARGDPAQTVMKAINYHLGRARISVLAAEQAADDFHARFSAVRRRYRYRILNRPARPALDAGRVWQVATHLNARAMQRAAQQLIGKHDFTTFRAVRCQALSPLKTLDVLAVARRGDEVVVRAEARSFLHNQVRAMVGTLKKVGEGKWPEAEVAEALEARDRARCGPTAPARGLTLVGVDYDDAKRTQARRTHPSTGSG